MQDTIILPTDMDAVKRDLTLGRGMSSERADAVITILQDYYAGRTTDGSRAELEERFRSAGFSEQEFNSLLVTLVKESVRPRIRIGMWIALLGTIILIAYLNK